MQRILHKGGISTTGLSAIMQELKKANIAVEADEWKLRQEVLQNFMPIRMVTKMPLNDSSTFFEWEYANPGQLIMQSILKGGPLSEAVATALAASPPSMDKPWHLVVGFDEFAPGNKLNTDNARKAMVLSFSFLELGAPSLVTEWGWWTPVVLRSSMLAQIRGGWSACLASFLHDLLLGSMGMMTAGIPIDVRGQPAVIFARRFDNGNRTSPLSKF